MHHMTMHVGQAAIDSVVAVDQTFMVNPQQMQNCRVKIVAPCSAFNGFVAPVVAAAVADACSHTSTGQPGHK